MSRLERLLNLTAALLATRRPLTAEELRKRITGYPQDQDKSAFRRMFERDKTELLAMGIPVEMAEVPAADPPELGYRIDPAAYEGSIRFEPDELAALHIANSIARLEGDDTGPVKLGVADVDSAAEMGRLRFHDAVAILIGAAAERKAVAFGYAGLDREVEPWRISFSRGHWYLTGWDRVRDDRRMYRVDRIEGRVESKDEAVVPVGDMDDPSDLKPWELGDGDPVKARVAIAADRAAWARRMFGENPQPAADGRVVVTLDVRDRVAFRSVVLVFMEHAEVLEPEDLRREVIDWLEAMR